MSEELSKERAAHLAAAYDVVNAERYVEFEDFEAGYRAGMLAKPASDVERDAALFRDLVAHCWDFKTHFDKNNQPKTVCATFKITTNTSAPMLEKIRMLVNDFISNAIESGAHQ